MDQRFGDYRVQTTQGVNFNAVNEREATVPDVGGTITVASFNVLNYFTTIDDGTNNARGANSSNEFTRQQDKLVSALQTIDADIVGLVELENDNDVTVQNLVDALNAEVGVGTYDFISTGTIGTDAIKVGMIYKTATISPVGSFAVLDDTVAPTFNDNRNRPSLAQTFQEIASGETLTVAVNHFKSKGSSGEATGADLDQGDEQGAWNATRTDAANALTNWLATDPTGSGDADFLIIGDLNAYAKEAPITTIQGAGYTNLIEKYSGKDAYSFNFDGQFGYLDHALANSSLESQITGVAEWQINADELNVFDYNDALIDAGENSSNPPLNPPSLYQVDPFRTSDHDPVIIGLNLSSTSVVNGTNRRDTLTGTNGDDTLTGFGGRDILTGNAGSDRFTYLRYGDLGDVITDFEVGVDLIVLTDLLDSLNYNGTAPFIDGYLNVAAYGTADSMLLVDFDGGGDTLRPFILLENVTEVDMENSSNFVV